ncbi:hypothetical protein [Halosimplex sp. J119]
MVLLLLALVGGGIGTFVLDDTPGVSPGVQTPESTPTAPPAPVEDVALTTPADATLLRASGVVPGEGGTSRLVLRNEGSAAGRLGIANFSHADEENGITSAEAAVDDSPDEGELSEAVRVRLSMQFSDGRTVRVVGRDRFVPLADVEASNRTYGTIQPGEAATVVLEWRVPAEAGNEIQSDGLRFDIAFGLRPINGTAA